MRILRTLPVVILLLLLLPISGRTQGDEESVSFSVSTEKTFASGEKPTINLWAQNLKELDFRVYRVDDPVEFFRKMKDYHNFGGQGPHLARRRTFLERWQAWKSELRSDIRDFVRAQFDESSRASIRDWMTAKPEAKKTARNEQQFPELPLLNPSRLVKRWTEPIPKTEDYWNSRSVPIDVKDKGVYLVEATNGKVQAYTIVIITDLAVITKTAPGYMLGYVVDRHSGQPVPNAQVTVLGDEDELAKGNTDASGLMEAKFPGTRLDTGVMLVRTKDDFVPGGPDWGFPSSRENSITGMVYTDRPIYRPGHTVHFKAILRSQSGNAYKMPPTTAIEVTINNPSYEAVYQKKLYISNNGTLHDDFDLPADAPLGYYSIDINTGALSNDPEMQYMRVGGGFEVEEYKKPEYAVTVTPSTQYFLQGQPITATIEARYYFGEPVANADVTYVVHENRYWSPFFMYGDFEEDQSSDDSDMGDAGDTSAYDNYYAGQQTEEKTGKLDADGKLTITIPTTLNPQHQDVRYRIEARVKDPAGREISGVNFTVGTYGSFAIYGGPTQYLYSVGGTADVKVQTRTYDNKPVSAPVTVELVHNVWFNGKNNPTSFGTFSGQTDSSGSTIVKVPLKEAGWFTLVLKAHTPEGRDVIDNEGLWVTGGSAEQYPETKKIQIIPDKKSYKPGDIAHILIVSGKTAPVLVTVEGDVVYSKQVVKCNGSATVDVPITDNYVGNIGIGAAFVLDNEYYEERKILKIPPDREKLSIDIQPSKPQFEPGEDANYTITVKDANGQPAEGEFSLGIVDEAIYAIRPDDTPDPMTVFYPPSYPSVGSNSSLTYSFRGEAGHRRMQLAGGPPPPPPTALGQIKGEKLVMPKVRKAFPDTALWLPVVETDSSGHATAKLQFPDSLTTWRATVRGATADTKVGAATSKVIVRKNIIVRLAVPRFFTQGDEVTVSVIAHNYLPTAKSVRMSLDVTGAQIIGGSPQDVNIASKDEAKLDFRLKIPEGTEAKLLAKALTDQESDAMEITLPVIPFGVKLAESHSGAYAQKEAEHTVDITFPQQIVPSSRTLKIDTAPSLAGAVFGALDFLTSYPYGCTEQTMSSFLPNVIVTDALKKLNVKSDIDPKRLEDMVKAGRDRLYDFQHDDGGWGWWKTDDSHPFMTAYVVAGLSQAGSAGYDVDTQKITRGADWLGVQLRRQKTVEPDLRAFMLYGLVVGRKYTNGKIPNDLIDEIWKQRKDMTPYGLGFMGSMFEMLDDSRGQDVADMLVAQAKQDDRSAWWESTRDEMLDFDSDASPEATAYAVKVLSHYKPDSPLLPKAVLWLLDHRDQGYYWFSTKQTAMVVYGLTDYLAKSGELKPNFSVEVFVNDKSVLSKTFTADDALKPGAPTVTIPADQLAPGVNHIRIKKSGDGRLYWSVRAEYYSTEEKLQRTGSIALNVVREYFKLTPQRENDQIVYSLDPLNGPLQNGDVIAVKLTVSGGDWKYLMIEDPIPAGTEFVANDNLYTIKGGAPPWWGWWFTNREDHDNRITMFQTYFNRGQQQYIYLLKVVNSGVFRVSPTRVQPMYQPQYLATSDSRTVEVK